MVKKSFTFTVVSYDHTIILFISNLKKHGGFRVANWTFKTFLNIDEFALNILLGGFWGRWLRIWPWILKMEYGERKIKNLSKSLETCY